MKNYGKETFVKDWDSLRTKRMLAREALYRAGKPEFKPYMSAKWTDFYKDEHNRMIAAVQHEDIKGCTQEMIKWFFEHLACCTTWNGIDFSGPEVSIYHLWHHRDHVAVTPVTNVEGKKNLGFLEGAVTRIHELTNEVNDVVYYEMKTIALNNHDYIFNVTKEGKAIGHVKHVYEDNGHGGSTFYCETEVGLQEDSKQSDLINKVLVPKLYSKEQGIQWIHHNVQETGRMQDILPVLYDNQDKVFFDPEFTKFD
ncbi:MAG: hypothetical protein ACOYJF_07470 [Prevotella sp.]|jgi:hypothetical protein